LSPNRRDRITPDIIRGLTPRQFRRICYGNGYWLIFSNRKLRNAVSPQQIAAVDPSYVDEMLLHKLNSKQLRAVTPQQLLRLGTGDIIPRYRPIMLKKVKKVERKFDSRQRKAFKIAEKRILSERRWR
jgi:hypothetical protein